MIFGNNKYSKDNKKDIDIALKVEDVEYLLKRNWREMFTEYNDKKEFSVGAKFAYRNSGKIEEVKVSGIQRDEIQKIANNAILFDGLHKFTINGTESKIYITVQNNTGILVYDNKYEAHKIYLFSKRDTITAVNNLGKMIIRYLQK